MASGKVGVYWSDREVNIMLQGLIEEEAGERVMTSTHLENLSIFSRVATRLEKEGFIRTPEQCRSKYKREKSSFYDVIEQYGSNPPKKARGPRFGLLHDLWRQGGCPDWRQRKPGSSSKARVTVGRRNGKALMESSPEDSDGEDGHPPPRQDKSTQNLQDSASETHSASENVPLVPRSNEYEELRRSINELKEANHVLEKRVQELEKITQSQQEAADQTKALVLLHQQGILKLKGVVDRVRLSIAVSAQSRMRDDDSTVGSEENFDGDPEKTTH